MSLFLDDSQMKFDFEPRLSRDQPPDPSKNIVCKYWIFGRCQMGENCPRLHVYDRSKMDLCQFYLEFNQCNRPECIFLHIRKEDTIKECLWYKRGFCKLGPNCKNRHVQRILCPDYAAGFCTKGKTCEYSHPTFNMDQVTKDIAAQNEAQNLYQKLLSRSSHGGGGDRDRDR